MKKKIVLILSIMAIAICVFALSVSAEVAHFTENDYLDFSRIVYTASYNGSCHMDVSVEAAFVNGDMMVGFITQHFYDKSEVVGIINVNFWHGLFTSYGGINSPDDLESAFMWGYETGYFDNEIAYPSNYIFDFSDSVYETYVNYLESINEPTYDDGYNDGYDKGVTEFKESVEYQTSLDNARIEGATEFKESVEYQNSLDIARTEGRSEGKMEFVKSKEYANALSIEYDKGFQDGINDDSVEASDVIGMALGVGLIAALAIICIMAFNKKKKKRY